MSRYSGTVRTSTHLEVSSVVDKEEEKERDKVHNADDGVPAQRPRCWISGPISASVVSTWAVEACAQRTGQSEAEVAPLVGPGRALEKAGS